MPTETRPRTGFPKNKLYKLAQKYKANFYHRKNLSFNSGMLLLLLLILTLRSIVYIESMDANNLTTVTEFILVGFTDYHMLEIPLFLTFLIFYIITLLGNVGMIVLIQVDVQLHTPMYFFLSHLALLDACYASVITPQILATLATGTTVISYGQCGTQFFFFTFCAGTECFLLAVMAYDRYVAVSNPLLYTVAMNPRICWSLVVEAYVCGMLGSIVRTTCTFTLSFCDHNQINFFFCDLPPLLKLACSSSRPF